MFTPSSVDQTNSVNHRIFGISLLLPGLIPYYLFENILVVAVAAAAAPCLPTGFFLSSFHLLNLAALVLDFAFSPLLELLELGDARCVSHG